MYNEWFSHMHKLLHNISFSLKIQMVQAKMNLHLSPRNSPRQLAIAKHFAEANSVFIVITSAKATIAQVIIS